MEQTPSVQNARAYVYTVTTAEAPPVAQSIGRLIITEHTEGYHASQLMDASPEYGFRVLDANGSVIAEIATGQWAFVKKLIEQAARTHSAHCKADCDYEIGEFRVELGVF